MGVAVVGLAVLVDVRERLDVALLVRFLWKKRSVCSLVFVLAQGAAVEEED